MAGTSSGAGGAAGRAPAADQVRNVVLVGHSGTGKSSLVEALLAATGTIQRPGSIEEGTTVSDFDETEVRQQRSVNLTLAPIIHNGIKVNLLDTPGYADFTGDLRAGLRAADSALFAVSATDGIDGVTRMLWEECAAVGMPRAVVITKIDHQRAEFQATLDACREAFGDAVAPLYLPVGEPVTGLIGLLSQKLYSYSGGERTEGAPAAADEDAHDRPARRADRGRHHRERGRDPHGQVPVRRGDRPQGADRGPGEGGRAGQLLPGARRLRAAEDRHARAARGDDRGVPLPRRAPAAARSPRRTASPSPAWPPTPRARCWPRWSRPRPTPTSAGSAWSGCSPARCAPTPPCTCPGTAAPPAGTRTTTTTSGSAR